MQFDPTNFFDIRIGSQLSMMLRNVLSVVPSVSGSNPALNSWINLNVHTTIQREGGGRQTKNTAQPDTTICRQKQEHPTPWEIKTSRIQQHAEDLTLCAPTTLATAPSRVPPLCFGFQEHCRDSTSHTLWSFGSIVPIIWIYPRSHFRKNPSQGLQRER